MAGYMVEKKLTKYAILADFPKFTKCKRAKLVLIYDRQPKWKLTTIWNLEKKGK